MSEEKSYYPFPEWLNHALKNGETVEGFLPQRLPLVDQALELAKLMGATNTPAEIGELLSCAAKCFKQFSTPVYIIKDKNG